jgi:hypothetical protein
MIEVICLSAKTSNNAFIFPLYAVAPKESLFKREGSPREPNLRPQFVGRLAKRLGVPYAPSLRNAEQLAFGPVDVLNYTVAVLNSATYRARYSEFLSRDFPRIPLPGTKTLFDEVGRLGGALVSAQLLESNVGDTHSKFRGGERTVSRVGWTADNGGTVWIDGKGSGTTFQVGTSGFSPVPEAVWNFHIGGYQVCEKWLKSRKDRKLSDEDITHYNAIVVALAETIRLMKEIDEVIERHGGWPGAFAQGTPANDAVHAEAGVGASPAGGQRASLMDDGEPESADPDEEAERSISIDDVDADELMCAARQLFNDGTVRNRDTAIGDLAGQVGFARVGSRIRESLDNAVRTAVRRGILENNGSGLRIHARSLEEYDRAFLKDQFLASLQGKAWTEREDAVQGFARWMGFRRTGSTIADTARSLINGLIREERLESDGSRVRRCG